MTMSNSKRIACAYCEGGNMHEVSVTQDVRAGRSKLVVSGILQWECDTCATVMTDGSQYAQNSKVVEAAEVAMSGYTTPAMLKHFREKYCLSQREASRLIGAGSSSFGKYESGSHLSKPCAKLIRVAMFVPEAARFLAHEEGIEIGSFPLHDDVWDLEGIETNRTTIKVIRDYDDSDSTISSPYSVDHSLWEKPSNLVGA